MSDRPGEHVPIGGSGNITATITKLPVVSALPEDGELGDVVLLAGGVTGQTQTPKPGPYYHDGDQWEPF